MAVFNDISGFGRCSLTASLPIITASGVECCPAVTAVLSRQTAFDGYKCFELTDEREASNALIISPEPDSTLRMAMHIKGLTSPIKINDQPLTEFERIGFTAVEWGGCIH